MIQMGHCGSGFPHTEKHKAIGFLIKTGQEPLENHKATKSASRLGR